MKKIYKNIPHTMKNMETFGFSWMDFVTAIPSPLFVVTTYKSMPACSHGHVLTAVQTVFTPFFQV